jgi:hypothetical protein
LLGGLHEHSLAVAELYMTLALVFRRLEFELYDTIEERDVAISHDCTIGMVDYSSVGIRARVAGLVGS